MTINSGAGTLADDVHLLADSLSRASHTNGVLTLDAEVRYPDENRHNGHFRRHFSRASGSLPRSTSNTLRRS